jgi:hypothetical protein
MGRAVAVHNREVRFANLPREEAMHNGAWIAVALLAACGPQATSELPVADSEQVLFDGRSLDGWEPRGDAEWIVENGYLTTVPGTGDGFLTTTAEYTDFRVRVEFWADELANGGIYLRVPVAGPGVNPSYEVNIMDSHAEWPTGSISGIALYDAANTVGSWNSFDIEMRGDRVTVLLNGDEVADGAASRSERGRIALQKLGEGVIRYRNVTVAPL